MLLYVDRENIDLECTNNDILTPTQEMNSTDKKDFKCISAVCMTIVGPEKSDQLMFLVSLVSKAVYKQ